VKKKTVWIYLIGDSAGGSPMAFTHYQTARKERKADIDYGYTVSPIVRIDVPLPSLAPEGGNDGR